MDNVEELREAICQKILKLHPKCVLLDSSIARGHLGSRWNERWTAFTRSKKTR